MPAVIILNDLHASAHIACHSEHANSPTQRRHSVEVPQAAARVFVAVAVEDDASHFDDLIKLIDESNHPVAAMHGE